MRTLSLWRSCCFASMAPSSWRPLAGRSPPRVPKPADLPPPAPFRIIPSGRGGSWAVARGCCEPASAANPPLVRRWLQWSEERAALAACYAGCRSKGPPLVAFRKGAGHAAGRQMPWPGRRPGGKREPPVRLTERDCAAVSPMSPPALGRPASSPALVARATLAAETHARLAGLRPARAARAPLHLPAGADAGSRTHSAPTTHHARRKAIETRLWPCLPRPQAAQPRRARQNVALNDADGRPDAELHQHPASGPGRRCLRLRVPCKVPEAAGNGKGDPGRAAAGSGIAGSPRGLAPSAPAPCRLGRGLRPRAAHGQRRHVRKAHAHAHAGAAPRVQEVELQAVSEDRHGRRHGRADAAHPQSGRRDARKGPRGRTRGRARPSRPPNQASRDAVERRGGSGYAAATGLRVSCLARASAGIRSLGNGRGPRPRAAPGRRLRSGSCSDSRRGA